MNIQLLSTYMRTNKVRVEDLAVLLNVSFHKALQFTKGDVVKIKDAIAISKLVGCTVDEFVNGGSPKKEAV